jgi:hypothetical protein
MGITKKNVSHHLLHAAHMIAFPSWISEFVVSSLQQLLSGNGSSRPPLTLKTYYL